MNLAYLRILQRAWDRYDIDHQGEASRPSTCVRVALTPSQKVAHLTCFMTANKKHGTTIKVYEQQVELPHGNIVTFTKWLMTGKLNVGPGELLDFFTARWAANKVVKREVAHAE